MKSIPRHIGQGLTRDSSYTAPSEGTRRLDNIKLVQNTVHSYKNWRDHLNTALMNLLVSKAFFFKAAQVNENTTLGHRSAPIKQSINLYNNNSE